MNAKQRKFASLLDEALEKTLGIKVLTNDAQRLQRELGGFRVWARNKGETAYEGLTIRVLRPEDSDEEFVHIVKKLAPDEIAKVQKLLVEEKENGAAET